MAKSIDDFINLFRTVLGNLGSPLAKFSKFSNVYLLLRSFAVIASEQEYNLETAQQNLFTQYSQGNSLDLKAYDYGLIRKQGARAQGTVLVKTAGDSITLPSGLVLSTADSTLQFSLISGGTINATESTLIVEALSTGSANNLSPGTFLYSSFFPQLKFVVGKYRNPLNGLVEGALTGGQDSETDEAFRRRILFSIRSLGKGTLNAIQAALLNIEGINTINIQENIPGLGYLTIFVDTQNSQVIQQAQNIVQLTKAAGIGFTIRSFESQYINVDLTLKIAQGSNSSDISTAARQIIGSYLTSASSEGVFDPNYLGSYFLQIPNVIAAEIKAPSNIVTIDIGSLLQLSSLNITFKEVLQ